MLILDGKGIRDMMSREQGGRPESHPYILYILPVMTPTPVWKGGARGYCGWWLANTWGSSETPYIGFDCRVSHLPEFDKGKEMAGGWVFRTRSDAVKAARAYEVEYAKVNGIKTDTKSLLPLVVLDWPGVYLKSNDGGGVWANYYLKKMKSAWRKWRKAEDKRERGENVEPYLPWHRK